ncbi:hypothetical protein NE237_021258 [Protea cynaroides]|uniref:Uncharacterized protein n=1 Tax=Protea cynaroides TaxID=273540 RepID=A0A9Q0H862_9MAGN|nr:hypothetical protein NE237_021258 [Protea cynaroides]
MGVKVQYGWNHRIDMAASSLTPASSSHFSCSFTLQFNKHRSFNFRNKYSSIDEQSSTPLWDAWRPEKETHALSLSDVVWPSAGQFGPKFCAYEGVQILKFDRDVGRWSDVVDDVDQDSDEDGDIAHITVVDGDEGTTIMTGSPGMVDVVSTGRQQVASQPGVSQVLDEV